MARGRRGKSREERQKDFEAQAAARGQVPGMPQPPGHPGQPQQVPFNPNPLGVGAGTGVTTKVVHHTPNGNVEIDPNQAMMARHEAAAAARQQQEAQPVPQPQPAQRVQAQQVPNPNAVPVAQHPQAPLAQPPAPQPQPGVQYPGMSPMPVTQGEVPPSSSIGPAHVPSGVPTTAIAPGMAPSHVQSTPGVFPPSGQLQPRVGPPAGVGPQQLVTEVVEGDEAVEPIDVTVILTSWARPGYLRPQFFALGQGAPPSSLVAWVNPPPAGGPPGVPVLDEEILSAMLQTRSTFNVGAWPRFDFARSAAQTEYVAILDDDAIPAPGWLVAAIKAIEDEGVAVAVTGSLFDGDGNETVVGGVGSNSEQTIVDAGRQGWVVRREWLDAIAQYPRKGHQHYGWGIHITAALQKLGIDTVVLPYAEDGEELWGTTVPEADDGLRHMADVDEIRGAVFKAYRELGWKLQSEGAAK